MEKVMESHGISKAQTSTNPVVSQNRKKHYSHSAFSVSLNLQPILSPLLLR